MKAAEIKRHATENQPPEQVNLGDIDLLVEMVEASTGSLEATPTRNSGSYGPLRPVHVVCGVRPRYRRRRSPHAKQPAVGTESEPDSENKKLLRVFIN